MNKKRTRLLYSLFIAITTIFFMYVLFPSDTVKAYIEYKLSQLGSDVKITFNSVSPSFPSGLKFSDVNVVYAGNPVDAKYVSLSPSYMQLIMLKPAFSYKANIYGGIIKGDVTLLKGSSKSRNNIALDASFSDIKLPELPIQNSKVTATLNGDVTYKNAGRGKESIDTDVTISNCKIELANAIKGLDVLKTFTFDKIEIVAQGDMRNIDLKKCDLSGDQAGGNISGQIRLRKPYERSRLKLEGLIKPNPDYIQELKKTMPVDLLKLYLGDHVFDTGVRFNIDGRLDSPKFALK